MLDPVGMSVVTPQHSDREGGRGLRIGRLKRCASRPAAKRAVRQARQMGIVPDGGQSTDLSRARIGCLRRKDHSTVMYAV